MSTPSKRLPSWRYGTVAVVCLVGLTLSAVVARELHERDRALARTQFERTATGLWANLRAMVREQTGVLDFVAGLFEASQEVEPEEFAVFARRVLRNHPALAGMGWAPRVTREERAGFEARAREAGAEGFGIFERDEHGERVPAPDRDEHFPVMYSAPDRHASTVVGFDLASEPLRAETLAQARDSGQQVTTARIALEPKEAPRTGVLIIEAVYGAGPRPATIEARRAALLGFCTAVLDLDAAVTSTVGSSAVEGLSFELTDLSAVGADRALGSYEEVGGRFQPGSLTAEPGLGQWSASLDLPGRSWAVTFTAGPTFEAAAPRGWLVFGLGAFVTLAVGLLMALTVRRASALAGISDRLAETNQSLEDEVRERRRTEQALRASQERLAEISDHIRDVFWLYDVTSRQTIYVSRAFEDVWGIPAAEVLARPSLHMDSILPEDQDEARRGFLRMMRSPDGASREYRIRRPDGQVRLIEERGFAIRHEDGHVLRVAGLAEDVTERRQATAQREALEERLRQVQKLESLGVLAGGVAHDFNNILMAILGNVDLALMRMPPGTPGRENIARIELAARSATELTSQMLAYAGRGQGHVEPVDLSALVEETATFLRTALSRRADLRLELGRDLPPVMADKSQLRQIAMNLMTNASDALTDGSGVIRAETGLMRVDGDFAASAHVSPELPHGDCVYLEVTDTGVGMEPDAIGRIFEPFYTTKATGRGLGLAATLGIVRSHRGAVRVTSEPGKGSTFRVVFPAAPRVEAAPGAAAASPLADLTGMVLVVDDDAAVREVARGILESAGVRVLTAGDGREGVDTFALHCDEVTVVLLDMTMPIMGGEEAMREIRRLRSDARIIVMSGYHEADLSPLGPGIDFIVKPFRAAQLLDRVRAAAV